MNLYQRILNKYEKISVIGLGYVGMPLAIAFAKVALVIGFDVNEEKIKKYNEGIDVTNEVGNDAVKNTTAIFTTVEDDIKKCKFHIVAVPTPITSHKMPNLKPVICASEIIGRNLTKGSIVVYESTVYPGVTEDICVPILEKQSGLRYGVDFKVGYSPERINPGDKVNRLETIVKIVSGMDDESLETIAKTYELIIEAGVYRAESIKVAEAAKVIENSQRDINIAFMNELSMVFNKMNIDTKAVLKAAGTKWNFLNFSPGLVGGHCIGVDPYYFIYKAEDLGYHSQIILAGRRINDEMGKYVAENTVKKLISIGKQVKGSIIAVLGITFKENCPDTRNSKVIDVIRELEGYGVNIKVVDPVADSNEVMEIYNIKLHKLEDISDIDAVIVAVAHNEFTLMSLEDIKKLYVDESSMKEIVKEVATSLLQEDYDNKDVLIDVKGIYDKNEAEKMKFSYWRL